jgi:hypothetical protein
MILRILGWLVHVGEALIAINLLTLLIAAFAKRARGIAGGLLLFSTNVWALILIASCTALVFLNHGWPLTIIGLLVGGVGIIPVAFVSALVNRAWLDLFNILFQVALVAGGWYMATRLMMKE